MSHYTPSARSSAQDKIFNINWTLLGRRLRTRVRQLFSSARYRAGQTEYLPPSWMEKFHLTWFRIGLIALAAFVITQKQIDFTVTVGAPSATIADGSEGNPDPVNSLSVFSPLGKRPATGEKPWSVEQYSVGAVEAYVDRFSRVARTEEEKFAIPAPAKMAMAIVESQAGEGADFHNHFPSATAGQRYDNAWSSWRAHSQLLQRRFPELAHESVNYQQWIDALVNTGYSQDPAYGQKLTAVIERFGLANL